MIKIGLEREIEAGKHLPVEVVEVIRNIANILEEDYGAERDIDSDMGGYILIVESITDFQQLKEESFLDIEKEVVPEFVDLIKCSDGKLFTNTLILCNNDFGISIIMPMEITPYNLKEYIVE